MLVYYKIYPVPRILFVALAIYLFFYLSIILIEKQLQKAYQPINNFEH